MTNDQKNAKWKMPKGLVNQTALFVASALFAISIYRLITQLLFAYRLPIPEPRDYDIASKMLFLLACIIPVFLRDFWRRHSFLLIGFASLGVASLFLRLTRFVSPEQLIPVEVLVSLLWSFATAIFSVGLLRGQRADKFFAEWSKMVMIIVFTIVMFLPFKLFGVDLIAELKKHQSSDSKSTG